MYFIAAVSVWIKKEQQWQEENVKDNEICAKYSWGKKTWNKKRPLLLVVAHRQNTHKHNVLWSFWGSRSTRHFPSPSRQACDSARCVAPGRPPSTCRWWCAPALWWSPRWFRCRASTTTRIEQTGPTKIYTQQHNNSVQNLFKTIA